MSSPGARQRRRRNQYQAPRGRAELAIAVAVAAGIVIGTAIMIWLLRPGGLADRQPRSSWLVAAALIAAITAVWLILRNTKDRDDVNPRLWIAGSLAGVLVVAVVAGIFWPSGLLRHTPPPITAPPTSAPSATTTTPAGTSTTKPGTATTQPATSTTAPTATTTATTTAPTTSTP